MLSDRLQRFLVRLDVTSRRWKKVLLSITDAGVIAIAGLLAPLTVGIPPLAVAMAPERWALIALLIAAGLALNARLGIYSAILRRMDVSIAPRMMVSALCLAALSGLLARAIDVTPGRLAETVVLGSLVLVGMTGARILGLGVLLSVRRMADGDQPVVIYGAGRLGCQLQAALSSGTEYRPIAFVDDDPSLHRLRIGALEVLPPKALATLKARHGLRHVVLALPAERRRQRREITEALSDLGLQVLSVPSFTELLSGKVKVSDLNRVEIDELLPRDVVDLAESRAERWLEGRTILVTGAGGSIGAEVARQIFSRGPRCLILLDIAEFALFQIDAELRRLAQPHGDRIEILPVLGSITDRARMAGLLARHKPDWIFHAAAYKHVPLVEANALPAIRNNALGTALLADLAGEAGVGRFVLVSTDKAVRPTNVMGATKRVAELAVCAAQARHPSTVFAMVRFGNVLGSSGSVVPIFEAQIARGGPVTVTHPDVIRYFMTIPEAAQLVIAAGLQASGGEVFVLDMGEPVRIRELAERMISLSGATLRSASNPDGDIEIVYTGLRPGEKLFEELQIGGETAPTGHPKIFAVHEPRRPERETRGLLAALETAIATGDLPGALALLGGAVEGYRPGPAGSDPAAPQPAVAAGPAFGSAPSSPGRP